MLRKLLSGMCLVVASAAQGSMPEEGVPPIVSVSSGAIVILCEGDSPRWFDVDVALHNVWYEHVSAGVIDLHLPPSTGIPPTGRVEVAGIPAGSAKAIVLESVEVTPTVTVRLRAWEMSAFERVVVRHRRGGTDRELLSFVPGLVRLPPGPVPTLVLRFIEAGAPVPLLQLPKGPECHKSQASSNQQGECPKGYTKVTLTTTLTGPPLVVMHTILCIKCTVNTCTKSCVIEEDVEDIEIGGQKLGTKEVANCKCE